MKLWQRVGKEWSLKGLLRSLIGLKILPLPRALNLVATQHHPPASLKKWLDVPDRGSLWVTLGHFFGLPVGDYRLRLGRVHNILLILSRTTYK